MTHALYYPPANRSAQWYANKYPGTTFTSMEKLLLHSTEGSGWPGYDGGAKAPNMTGMPNVAARRIDWRQHWPVNQSSRALLIGTCVPGGPGMFWPDAPDWALQGIADLYAWLHDEWDIPIVSTVSWRAWNAPGDGQRLSNEAYNAYRGLLAHEHAPQNDHRDIGALDADRLIHLAAGGTNMSETNPTKTEVSQAVLFYDLGAKYVNPLTILSRLYDTVSAQTGILTAIQQAEADDQEVDVHALAAAIVAGLPQIVANQVDPALLATAVADKLAARLAS